MARRKVDKIDVSPDVPLIGVFAEFRQALRDEIAASKLSASAGAVPLRGGRLVATLGSGFQYEFEMESPLDFPGDAPGQLTIPGRGEFRVSIIQVQGTTLRISLEQSLNQFVPIASLQSDLSMLMLKLIDRIEKKSSLPGLAGARLFPEVDPQGEDASLDRETDERLRSAKLNEDQKRAVRSVLGRDTTYIWGPPGTGKTKTIGSIGAELFRRGKSLLVVSHTNSAVDGALVEIASAILGKDSSTVALDDTESIAHGTLVRVGQPTSTFPEHFRKRFLLSEEVKRRSAELAARKESLSEERGLIGVQLQRLQGELDLHFMVADGRSVTVNVKHLASDYKEVSESLTALEQRLLTSQPEFDLLARIHPFAVAAKRSKELMPDKRAQLHNCHAEINSANRRMELARIELAETVEQLSLSEKLEPRRAALRGMPTEADLSAAFNVQDAKLTGLQTQFEQHRVELPDFEMQLAQTNAASLVMRMWKRLPDPEEAKRKVDVCRERMEHISWQIREVEARWKESLSALEERRQLASELASYEHIPSSQDCREQLSLRQHGLESAQKAVLLSESSMQSLRSEIDEMERELEQFRQLTSELPEQVVLKHAELHFIRRETEQTIGRSREQLQNVRGQIDDLLNDKLAAFHTMGIIESLTLDPLKKVDAFELGLSVAGSRIAKTTPNELSAQIGTLANRLQLIASEIAELERQLTKVADAVIAQATVVGATLTAAFLRDAIQNRRFDTVLLDEASMASIPALWTAASTCERALVLVGDFEQLPPVVIAKTEVATKWLGKDVFDHREIPSRVREGRAPAFLVQLREQHRMASAICEVVNELVYGSTNSTGLRTADWILQREHRGDFPKWVSKEWQHRAPILLVDTHSIDAWVTPVAHGKSASRLNFLSATVCADIARRMIDPERTWSPGDETRILVVSPYKPHSKLVGLMLKDASVKPAMNEREALAGTAHAFQGMQSDIVIVDLVNDTPHWKVGMFTPAYDNTTKRLLNVAVTRAKHQLIVVGDFKYCQQSAKKAFIGREFIPAMRRQGELIDATRIVPSRFFVRAACTQSRLFGGSVEAPHARTVVRETSFYEVLATDLIAARDRVVIYSPFITPTRLANLEAQLRALIERGVRLFVVTKTLTDRDKPSERKNYERVERTMRSWGITVIHKNGMHEKLVLIDNHIVWTGSLNPLSFNANKTQEIMERREDARVFKDYAETLMLDGLLGPCATAAPACPICKAEVVAAEGSDSPFYWRCSSTVCAFKTSAADSALLSGEVLCSVCRGTVALKENPGRELPWCWVCENDSSHRHQGVKSLHLKLPKMQSRLPAAKLLKIEKSIAAYKKKKDKEKREPGLF